VVATFAPPASALGDSLVDTTNERPNLVIKRILEAGGEDKALLGALARFVKVGDSEEKLRRRLGDPLLEQNLQIWEKAYYYRSHLLIILKKDQVSQIGSFGKGIRFLKPD
jgi:hypothetical protein